MASDPDLYRTRGFAGFCGWSYGQRPCQRSWRPRAREAAWRARDLWSCGTLRRTCCSCVMEVRCRFASCEAAVSLRRSNAWPSYVAQHSPPRLSLWGEAHIETGDDWASNWPFDQWVTCANVDAIPAKDVGPVHFISAPAFAPPQFMRSKDAVARLYIDRPDGGS